MKLLYFLISISQSCLVCLLIECCYAQNIEVTSLDLEIEVNFSGGVLLSSKDLKNWVQVATVSPYKEKTGDRNFYKVSDQVVRVPIIAHTGQSNSNGAANVPNREPYLSEELPIYFSRWVQTCYAT